ncbi:hypothetical protein E2562_003159 [Oryza meyeriana var. granulata]|uniref:Uncharacterized protein n=1 Tax=Oryza meyeriana var. granulata TaxID=110450 RepID=A0A6G1EUM6_9ORYZ|nr:hypothetical protein E2562_003159 [Oryza meyeriana var. granulata]
MENTGISTPDSSTASGGLIHKSPTKMAGHHYSVPSTVEQAMKTCILTTAGSKLSQLVLLNVPIP